MLASRAAPGTELEMALANEPTPGELPIGLPLAHLTANRWLEAILKAGQLEPRDCKIFSKQLLYFSYGGVFYRPSAMQTECATELPVALVFAPGVTSAVTRLFPFDSGAAAKGLFGADWSRKLAPFASRFSVTTKDALLDARRLIYHLFETNTRYLSGHAAATCKATLAPLPLLHDFLVSDLSSLNVDHRQRTVEGITEVAVALAQHLLWVGLPEFKTSTILRELYRWTAPNVIPVHTYGFTKNFNPSEIAARLEDRAKECVINRYASFV